MRLLPDLNPNETMWVNVPLAFLITDLTPLDDPRLGESAALVTKATVSTFLQGHRGRTHSFTLALVAHDSALDPGSLEPFDRFETLNERNQVISDGAVTAHSAVVTVATRCLDDEPFRWREKVRRLVGLAAMKRGTFQVLYPGGLVLQALVRNDGTLQSDIVIGDVLEDLRSREAFVQLAYGPGLVRNRG